MDSLNSIAVDLAAASGRVGAQMAAVVRKTAYDIEATGQAFAPVDTGNLRSSISTSFEGDGRTGSVTAEIGPTADYGSYVEFGTSQHAPQAYMGPALDRHAGQLVKAAEQLAAEVL